MRTLVIAEHDNQTLKAATLPTLTAAAQLGQPVDVLIVGSDCQPVAEQTAGYSGIDRVLIVDDPVYRQPLAEPLTALTWSLADGYRAILAPATSFGKNLIPRLAALLDVSPVSDIIAIESADTFRRPIYAGNVIATVQSTDPVKLITVRTTAFEAVGQGDGSAPIETVTAADNPGLSEFVGAEITASERPDLTAARIVISGGRGMQSGDNFALLETIADRLGAAIGASRAAVDAGFVPNDYQVGQTGKVVAPELYIAVGISGAIQHLAGMKDSKFIVAINKDEEAPIFQVADYGLVADLFDALPELADQLATPGESA